MLINYICYHCYFKMTYRIFIWPSRSDFLHALRHGHPTRVFVIDFYVINTLLKFCPTHCTRIFVLDFCVINTSTKILSCLLYTRIFAFDFNVINASTKILSCSFYADFAIFCSCSCNCSNVICLMILQYWH